MTPVTFKIEKININKIDVPEEVKQWTNLPDVKLIRWKFQVGFTREAFAASPDRITILTIALLERLSDKSILSTININTIFELSDPIPPAERIHFLHSMSETALSHLEGVCSQALADTVYKNQIPTSPNDAAEENIRNFLGQYWN